MAVTLINAHVLLPHLPDWSRPVQWSRTWQTGVDSALSGTEERRSLRPAPRASLSWRLVPFEVTDQTRLLARLRTALKTGLACAPLWGRGIRVASASGTALRLAQDAWDWLQADDYLLLRSLEADTPEAFEVLWVKAVDGPAVTLKSALAGAWPAGTWAWPLLFGRLTISDLSHRSDWHAGLTVTLRQLATPPDVPPVRAIRFDYWPDNVPFDWLMPPLRQPIQFDHWPDNQPWAQPA